MSKDISIVLENTCEQIFKWVLTSPSLGGMLVRWTTSRWADWETRESDDREIMWSHIPAKVLHCGGHQRWGEHWRGGMERAGDKKRRKKKKVIEIGFGPRGMPWPSWRMKEVKQKSFHLIVPHCHFHHSGTQIVSCHSLSTGMSERHCQRENNTALMPANPEVHGWHPEKHLNYPAQIAFVGMYYFLKTFFLFLHELHKLDTFHIVITFSFDLPVEAFFFLFLSFLSEAFHGHTIILTL